MAVLEPPPIEIESIDELFELMLDGVRRVQEADYEPVFRKVIKDFEEYHEFYFQHEVAYTGEPWAELSPITIEAKGHDTILVDTGRLRDSLTQTTGDSIREIVTDVHTPGFSYGTSVEYAIYHQTGTKRMPARPPLGITSAGMGQLTEDINDHLLGVFLIGAPNSR